MTVGESIDDSSVRGRPHEPADDPTDEGGEGGATPAKVPISVPLMAKIVAVFTRAKKLVRENLADGADVFMAGLIVLCLAVSIVNRSWLFTGHALTASMVGFALCFLVASRSLKNRPDLGPERAFISLAVMVSGVWLYEVAYHYGWLVPAQAFSVDASEFAISTSNSDNAFPLPWAILMIGLAFVGIRYMRINRWFLLCAAASIASMALWIAMGYPNLFHPEWWPHRPVYLDIIPPSYANARTPQAAELIAFYGGLLNSLTKVLVSILPATLYLGQPSAKGALRDSRGWKALMAWLGQVRGWPPEKAGEPVARPEEPTGRGDRVGGE